MLWKNFIMNFYSSAESAEPQWLCFSIIAFSNSIPDWWSLSSGSVSHTTNLAADVGMSNRFSASLKACFVHKNSLPASLCFRVDNTLLHSCTVANTPAKSTAAWSPSAVPSISSESTPRAGEVLLFTKFCFVRRGVQPNAGPGFKLSCASCCASYCSRATKSCGPEQQASNCTCFIQDAPALSAEGAPAGQNLHDMPSPAKTYA